MTMKDEPLSPSIVHIVDDDDLIRKGTVRLLAAAGYETRAYGNARDFLDAVEPGSAGCAILDVRLPDQNGLELQAALTKRDVSLPIIFMTGLGEVPESVQGSRHGGIAFLIKPVDSDVLLAAVSRALAHDAASRAGGSHRCDSSPPAATTHGLRMPKHSSKSDGHDE